MNHNVPSGSDLRFINSGTLGKSLSIHQLHVTNNIYNIYHKESNSDV